MLLLPPYQALLLQLYQGVLGPYWAERRKLVEVGYRGIEPGVQHFGLVVRRELETQQEQSVDSLVSVESCRNRKWAWSAETGKGIEVPGGGPAQGSMACALNSSGGCEAGSEGKWANGCMTLTYCTYGFVAIAWLIV
jgi:hypothetical protein